jgi:hypothetical protein
MTPWLRRHLLDPRHRQGFQPRILSINILDFELNQDTVIRRATHGCDPEGLTFGLAPQGEGPGLQGKFDRVAAKDLKLDLQHLLIEGMHRVKIGDHDRHQCELHVIFLSVDEDAFKMTAISR